MIRRNAAGFRALLMTADALLAVVLLVGLSLWRFGPDWAIWWRQIVPIPEGLVVIYAGGWVISLMMNGLYRPRARWSIIREAIDVLRATAVLALVTLSVLFVFKMPDVSRALPAGPLPDAGGRDGRRSGGHPPGRWSICGARARTCAIVLVLGAGPRGQMFAAKLEGHRELGLRVEGFLDDSPTRMSCRRAGGTWASWTASRRSSIRK